MLNRFLFLLAVLAQFASADVQFTTPSAGSSLAGGVKNTISVAWEESGDNPPLSSLTTYTIFLCAGGNDVPSQVGLCYEAHEI